MPRSLVARFTALGGETPHRGVVSPGIAMRGGHSMRKKAPDPGSSHVLTQTSEVLQKFLTPKRELARLTDVGKPMGLVCPLSCACPPCRNIAADSQSTWSVTFLPWRLEETTHNT